MAWDTEATKEKLKAAATELFAARGPDGTTVDAIAARAGVNKERLYAYFGSKEKLFSLILAEELATLARTVPIESLAATGVGDFAGRTFDYHVENPTLGRLLLWEGLTLGEDEVPDESGRRAYYREKVEAVAAAQADGDLDGDLDAGHLVFMITALAAWWAAVPQVARMLESKRRRTVGRRELAERRAAVVRAATRLAVPPRRWPGRRRG